MPEHLPASALLADPTIPSIDPAAGEAATALHGNFPGNGEA